MIYFCLGNASFIWRGVAFLNLMIFYVMELDGEWEEGKNIKILKDPRLPCSTSYRVNVSELDENATVDRETMCWKTSLLKHIFLPRG